MEATRSSCSESALDVCKSPEKMSKTFAKKVSKMGGKGYLKKVYKKNKGCRNGEFL